MSDERHECDNCERYVHGWAVDAERADRAEAEVTRLRAALARLLECPVSDQAAWDNALEVLRSSASTTKSTDTP